MEIAGHTKQREYLGEIAQKEAIPQSFLFTGPRGIGKKLVALEFSEELLGLQGEDILNHPDVLLIEPGREEEKGRVKRKRITIEEVRKAHHFLSRYPSRGRRRVLIIDEAEELSQEAANALLKLLEEPNETSILILVTHRPGTLPLTLLSRMLTLSFDLVEKSLLLDYFRKSAEDTPDFFFALGLPGLIVRSLEEQENFTKHKDFLGQLFRISKLTLRERMVLAEELSKDEEELPPLLEEWLMGMHARIKQSANESEQGKLLFLFDRLNRTVTSLLKREGNTRLLLEEMFLAL